MPLLSGMMRSAAIYGDTQTIDRWLVGRQGGRWADQAVRRPGFDADKGLLIHEALLSNPDAELVAAILDSSPFPLREERVREFVKDERKIPGGATVGEIAAKRLKQYVSSFLRRRNDDTSCYPGLFHSHQCCKP